MAENTIPLDQLKPGEKGVIRSYNGSMGDEHYLMELGLMIGTSVRLIKFAPFGDPIELRVRGYHLSIRRSGARSILVRKEKDN